ncbi:hypothetical protein N8I71_13805 [Roseibacterium sp. SDUM158016]|uniref:hypothetical protein n=1 Tax=Roseicyclus sediminis TaxID=2980997 RepID=UPI0021D0E3EE|nr:hypothetical protein [Roseibacterium sp. SDUM158016]MCU4653915.1 hypothetical protein [Roseibacterium sp. SDUM158016]
MSVGDLRAGDILLHRPTNPRWYEKGIAWYTASPYTHASIVLRENTIAEARFPRIRTWSVEATLERERALCVLRQKPELTTQQIGSLHDFVEKTLTQGVRFDFAFPYTFIRQSLVPLRLDEFPAASGMDRSVANQTDRYFCSSFVVACLCEMGVITSAEYCKYPLGRHSPADLLKDEKFGNVVGHIPGTEPN